MCSVKQKHKTKGNKKGNDIIFIGWKVNQVPGFIWHFPHWQTWVLKFHACGLISQIFFDKLSLIWESREKVWSQ